LLKTLDVDERRIKGLVQQQFGGSAQAYVSSSRHAHGDDLARLVELAQLRGDERVLDVATGGGHTALAFAAHAREIIAIDLTPQMLSAAEAFARGRGASNISFVHAEAEALPFPDSSFEVVVTRIAPHHFAGPARFVVESARVLTPGGRFLLDDNMAPADPELDEFMNGFERWRDPSHVRAYTQAEWVRMIEDAGLTVERVDGLASKAYQFDDWTKRTRMTGDQRSGLEAWLLAAPLRCKDFFHLKMEHGEVRSISGYFGIISARKDTP
jgi:ubiquinone/menaquinone biosynthesis C-methylase UbiE